MTTTSTTTAGVSTIVARAAPILARVVSALATASAFSPAASASSTTTAAARVVAAEATDEKGAARDENVAAPDLRAARRGASATAGGGIAAAIDQEPSSRDMTAAARDIGAAATTRKGASTPPTDESRSTRDETIHTEAKVVTTSKSIHRSVATLKLPKKVPALITYAQGIVKGMTGNSSFATPTPTLAAITEAINALQTAETAALARTKGAVATRNEALTALVSLLEQLRSYIQAQADANMENGGSIIQSAGIAVRKTAVRPPRVFAATPGDVTGSVKLVAAAAARRASYEWQYSTDGGKTWVTMPATLQAKTTLTGMTAGSTVEFKYRPVTKTGEGDWSQPVSLLVK